MLRLRLSERERGIEMKNLQIYRKERVCDVYYALVDKHGNWFLLTAGEVSDLCTDFRQDGSWSPVEFNDLPDWSKEQIEKLMIFNYLNVNLIKEILDTYR